METILSVYEQANNHLSPQIFEHENKKSLHKILEIHVQVWDRH